MDQKPTSTIVNCAIIHCVPADDIMMIILFDLCKQFKNYQKITNQKMKYIIRNNMNCFIHVIDLKTMMCN